MNSLTIWVFVSVIWRRDSLATGDGDHRIESAECLEISIRLELKPQSADASDRGNHRGKVGRIRATELDNHLNRRLRSQRCDRLCVSHRLCGFALNQFPRLLRMQILRRRRPGRVLHRDRVDVRESAFASAVKARSPVTRTTGTPLWPAKYALIPVSPTSVPFTRTAATVPLYV